MKICKVKDCGIKYYGRGYCNKHWQQIYTYGKILKRTKFTPNKIIDCGDYCKIITYDINRKEKACVLFSKQHIDKVKQFKWCIDKKHYCSASIKGKKIKLKLHHLIFGIPPKGLVIDHINRNPLDNRDENLRFATRRENALNTEIRKNNTSGATGVHWRKKEKCWRVRICVDYKDIFLGAYKNKNQAIKIRRKAENKYGVIR